MGVRQVLYRLPKVIEAVPKTGAACINRDVYLGLIEAGKLIQGHVVDSGYWSDLGTPSRYLATQADVLHGALDFTRFRPAILCVETLKIGTTECESEILDLMQAKDYVVRGGTFVNTIFVDNQLLRTEGSVSGS